MRSVDDITIVCKGCGENFTWNERDQEFFASKGFSQPKRCRNCRSTQRREHEAGAGSDGLNQGLSAERKLFHVVCSNCGQPTTVSFQPRGDQPVYCRDCFDKMGNRRGYGGGGGRPPSSRSPVGSGLGVTIRNDVDGEFTSITRRMPNIKMQLHSGRGGESFGSSHTVGDVTFHHGKDGKFKGSSRKVGGITLTTGSDGKLKSSTNHSTGGRTGRNGKGKGSSRRF